MKKILTAVAAGAVALSLAACGGPSEAEKYSTAIDQAHVDAGQQLVNHGRSISATSELSADVAQLRAQADDLRNAADATTALATEKTPAKLEEAGTSVAYAIDALADTVESAADNPDKLDLIKTEFDSRVKSLQQAIANYNAQVSR